MKNIKICSAILIMLTILGCYSKENIGLQKQSLIDITIDNQDSVASVITGSWPDATAATEHYGSNSLYATTGGTVDTFRFTPDLPEGGEYEVFAWNSCYSDRSVNVPHIIYDGVSSSSTVYVDQDCDTGSHGEWLSLGTFQLSAGENSYIEITDYGVSDSPYIGVDAVRFVRESTATTGSSGAGGAGGAGGSGGSGGSITNDFGLELFNGSTLSPAWNILNQSMFTYQVSNGQLSMEVDSDCSIHPFCAWFDATEGPLIYKNISGNFKASALVSPRKTSNLSVAPDAGYQFAGIIARDPDDSAQNYVFTVSGYRGSYLSNEIKSTVDDTSNITGPAYNDQSTADRELRLCRFGQSFYLYRKEIGETSWNHVNTYDRSSDPLPTELQIGLVSYTYDAPVNLTGMFDYASIESISSSSECSN